MPHVIRVVGDDESKFLEWVQANRGGFNVKIEVRELVDHLSVPANLKDKRGPGGGNRMIVDGRVSETDELPR